MKSMIVGAALLVASIGSAAAANVVATAAGAGTFNTLLAAAKAAGLADTLATTQGITVFAPTDAAFAKLPKGTVESLLKPENKDKLIAILTAHVVGSEIPASGVPHKATRVQTLNPKETIVALRTSKGVTIDGIRVVKADINADNGIIHVINRVILPDGK